MLLYISGSYPENEEGIAACAKVTLASFAKNMEADRIILLTTDTPIVTDKIAVNSPVKYDLMPNWHINRRNIQKLYKILHENNIRVIHMDYPGDLYGKTFLASFIPYLVHRYNRRYGTDIKVNVRLHEFTRSRFLRKVAIMPILFCADSIYVPAKKDRDIVGKFAGMRVHPTFIGSNITVIDDDIKPDPGKVTISYFGSVYPGKGIEHMLDIWKKIKQQDTDNKYIFKIIGDIGTENSNHFADYHKQVWKWITKYGLKDSIEVTGYLSDEDVSREIKRSSMATLFYEDGLTLRRGSFLAYLAHGIPIITSEGDEESIELFSDHPGITMAMSDAEIINKIYEYSTLSVLTGCCIHSKPGLRKSMLRIGPCPLMISPFAAVTGPACSDPNPLPLVSV